MQKSSFLYCKWKPSRKYKYRGKSKINPHHFSSIIKIYSAASNKQGPTKLSQTIKPTGGCFYRKKYVFFNDKSEEPLKNQKTTRALMQPRSIHTVHVINGSIHLETQSLKAYNVIFPLVTLFLSIGSQPEWTRALHSSLAKKPYTPKHR